MLGMAYISTICVIGGWAMDPLGGATCAYIGGWAGGAMDPLGGTRILLNVLKSWFTELLGKRQGCNLNPSLLNYYINGT